MHGECFILWKEHLKKKGEAYKNTQTGFRVSVIDKLVNNSFETMNDSLNDSLNNSFVGEFERLADNKHFLKKIPVTENSKKRRIFRTCKVCSLAEREFDHIRSLPKRKRTGRETHYDCSKCKVALSIDICFEIYHTQKDYVKKYINEFLKWNFYFYLMVSDYCRICSCFALKLLTCDSSEVLFPIGIFQKIKIFFELSL